MSSPAQLPDLRIAAQQLAVEAQAALLGHQEQILQIDRECQEYESTAIMLESLPKEGTPEIMVPLGKAAFFPGKLVDTQHCLVRMGALLELQCKDQCLQPFCLTMESKSMIHDRSVGDSMHLHCKTGEAATILHKRCQALKEKRTMLEMEIQASALG